MAQTFAQSFVTYVSFVLDCQTAVPFSVVDGAGHI
jgi:hypothetical protein